jgi:hypothetical protein
MQRVVQWLPYKTFVGIEWYSSLWPARSPNLTPTDSYLCGEIWKTAHKSNPRVCVCVCARARAHTHTHTEEKINEIMKRVVPAISRQEIQTIFNHLFTSAKYVSESEKIISNTITNKLSLLQMVWETVMSFILPCVWVRSPVELSVLWPYQKK